MKPKLFLLNSDKGFTITELLVAGALNLVLVALCLGTTVTQRRAFRFDMTRTAINQNLRSAMDVLNANLRQTGENLNSNFPALELIDGVAGAADELIVRRNVLDETLKLCTRIDAGTSTTILEFANASGDPGCSYSDNNFNYTSWQSYRSTYGGSVQAYLYDISTRNGEFFTYNSETDVNPVYALQSAAQSWQYTYPVGSSALYMIEEWRLSLNGDLLQLISDNDPGNPRTIANNIIDFQVDLLLADGSIVDAFSKFDDWTLIDAIHITLSGEETALGSTITKSLQSSYFPRNILSN